MEWIKIDKDNLPEGEVLAANFRQDQNTNKHYGGKIVGYLKIWDSGALACENDTDIIFPTHYIDINKFDIKD